MISAGSAALDLCAAEFACGPEQVVASVKKLYNAAAERDLALSFLAEHADSFQHATRHPGVDLELQQRLEATREAADEAAKSAHCS